MIARRRTETAVRPEVPGRVRAPARRAAPPAGRGSASTGCSPSRCSALLLLLRLWDPAPVEILRLRTFDAFQVLQPRAPGPRPVTIVDIDEDSIRPTANGPGPAPASPTSCAA